MSNGRPSQKFTKWARRKATTSCGWVRRIDSHVAMARSSSPSDQAVSAATWLRSRGVALEASDCASARRLDGDRNDGLLESQHGEITLHAMRQGKVRGGFQQCGETGRRIRAVSEVARDEVVVGGGSLGAGNRKRQAAGIAMHGVLPGRSGALRVRAWAAWQSARHTQASKTSISCCCREGLRRRAACRLASCRPDRSRTAATNLK